MNWNLRKAETKDKSKIENLFKLMLQSVYETADVQGYESGYLDKFFKNDGSWICVAEVEDRIVGYLSMEAYSDYLYLDDFCVDKEHRNLGIGTAFLKTAQNYAVEKNIPQIRLHVEKSNLNALKLYQRQEYKIINEDDTRYLMMKIL